MTTIEDRLEEALLRAIELTNETHNASSAVAKTACERKLTQDQARFVATAYNKAKAFALGGMLPDSQRGADFQLADPDEVVKIAFEVESEPLPKVASAPVDLPDVDEFLSERPLLKLAQENCDKLVFGEKTLNEHDMVVAQSELLKVAGEMNIAKERLCDALDKKEKYLHARAKEALHKAAEEFVKYPEGDRRKKVARRIVNGFGEGRGRAALSFISKVASCDVPEVERTASHSIFPADKIYTCVSDAGTYAARTKRVGTLRDELVKQAGPLDDIASSVSYGTLSRQGDSPFANLLKESLGSGERNKTLEELLPADVFARLKGLKSRRAFMDAVLTNPELQEFSLEALENAFNYSLETNPDAMGSPRVLSNIMLHNINQGNFDDIFSIKAKKDIDKSDTATRKTREELADILANRKKTEAKGKSQAKDAARSQAVDGGGFDVVEPFRGASKEIAEGAGTSVEKALNTLLEKRKESKASKTQAKGALADKELAEAKKTKEEQDKREMEVREMAKKELARESKIVDRVRDSLSGRLGRDPTSKQMSQKIGPEAIPVRLGGVKTYLKPEDVVRLEEAYEDRRLTGKGRSFYEPFRDIFTSLSSDKLKWDGRSQSKENVLDREIKKRDMYSSLDKGLDTGAYSLDELIIPKPPQP